jgi:hypothetical protein
LRWRTARLPDGVHRLGKAVLSLRCPVTEALAPARASVRYRVQPGADLARQIWGTGNSELHDFLPSKRPPLLIHGTTKPETPPTSEDLANFPQPRRNWLLQTVARPTPKARKQNLGWPSLPRRGRKLSRSYREQIPQGDNQTRRSASMAGHLSGPPCSIGAKDSTCSRRHYRRHAPI